MAASWPSGWLNCREYWMNACTPPMDKEPEATRTPPITATSTKLRLDTNHMAGWMMPETN